MSAGIEYKGFSTFSGINRDARPENVEPTMYEMALNAVRNGKRKGLGSEPSTAKLVPVTGNVVGRRYIEGRDSYVILLDTTEVGLFNTVTEKYTALGRLNDLESNSAACGQPGVSFGNGCGMTFSSCEWIRIEYNFWNRCSELHIEFSSGCTYYTVNIDALADPKRRAAMTCQDIQTFRCDCIPSMRAVPMDGGGAGLHNGSYRFVARLIDADGHRTNFFNVSNEVSVGSDKNKPGELGSQYVRLVAEGLNCRYGTMEIAVIKRIGGGTQAFIVDKVHYGTNGVSYDYTGQNGREIPIALEEVMIKKVNYLRGRQLKLHDGRMFYFQIRNDAGFNVQYYADVVGVRLPVYRVLSKNAHKFRGLQPLERYRLGLVYQHCDGTETSVGAIHGGASLEQRQPPPGGLEQRNDDDDYNENPEDGPPHITDGRDENFPWYPPNDTIDVDGEEEEEGDGGSYQANTGGGAEVTWTTTDKDQYLDYDQLPKDHHTVQNDSYYTDGCVNGTGACEDFGKAYGNGMQEAANQLPEDDAGQDCDPCGAETVTQSKNTIGRYLSAFFLGPGALFGGITIGANRNRKNKKNTQTAQGIKQTAQKMLDELKKEEVWVPNKTDVTLKNTKPRIDGGTAPELSPSSSFADQYDDINAFMVGYVAPKWVESGMRYPMTKNCSGGYIYGANAGKPERLLEIPAIKHFDSNSVLVESSRNMGVDETDGYVYMVGLEVYSVLLPTIQETGKPLCERQPWKIVVAPRDALNSRVVASGIAINTFMGEVNGRPHALARHAVNSPERIDRYIQTGGVDYDHTGTNGTLPLYTFYSPDCLLGGIPLVANRFIKTHEIYGDGYRHGLYAESTKEVGFFGRHIDNRGARQTISLSQAQYSYQDVAILGITKAEGNSIQDPPAGIGVPLCNKSRETCVYMRLGASVGDIVDKSFIADGLEHSGPILEARCVYGHLIRDMDMQYGSLVNARYADIGLYARGSSHTARGLVGDSHVGSFNLRRTSYISNRVGNRTFIPSPRHYSGIARFFGFGDPTEPPDSLDTRDPKNMANRYEGLTLMQAAAAAGRDGGRTSVYYPGTLKTLIYFFCQARVNFHYRERGDLDGQVHARNLGKMYIDAAVPVGVPWEESWLPRFYREIKRESKFHGVLRPLLRMSPILLLPLSVFSTALAIYSLFDIALMFVRVAIMIILTLILFFVLTPSRINRMMGLKAQLNDREGGADDENLRQWEDNYMRYNSCYDAATDMAPSIGIGDPFNVCPCDSCSETTYYRPGNVPTQGINNLIYYSARQYANTEINAFRDVLDGDYGEMPTNSGQLQDLFTINNQLHGITTGALYRMQYDGDPHVEGLDYLLGNGRALGTPMMINEGLNEGSFGTIDANSMEMTPAGLVIIDAKAKTINLYNGAGVDVISNRGMENFFREHLDFCTTLKCRDQKVEGNWYGVGWDPELKRIMVTKRDGSDKSSWTMSYDVEGRHWISAHSYRPNFYMWNRKKMFGFHNGYIWKHNDWGSRQILYGKYEPFVLWFYTNSMDVFERAMTGLKFKHVEINTMATDLATGNQGRNIFFSRGGWNNSYQTTGVWVFDTEYYRQKGGSDLRERSFEMVVKRPVPNVWRIHDVKDHIKDKNGVIVSGPSCEILPWLNHGNADLNSSDGRRSDFADFWLRHELVLDDAQSSGYDFQILRVALLGEKQAQ